MDVDRAVAARGAGHHLAFEVDSQDVLGGDLVEADAVALHEEQRRIVRQPHRDVATREVVLAFVDQHLAGPDHFFLDFGVRHLSHCSYQAFPLPIARQTRSGVAGISMCLTPNSESALTSAFATAGIAPTQPASPAPFAPIGLVLVGTGLAFTSTAQKSWARGMA